MENGMKIKGNEMEIKSLESHLKHILRALLNTKNSQYTQHIETML